MSNLVNDGARLKAAIDLALEIGRDVQLVRRGKRHVGLCPFHIERTPSFTVEGDRYRCYGCDAAVDIFDWLRLRHSKEFANAISYLRGAGHLRRDVLREPEPAADPSRSDTAEAARRIWMEAIDPRDTPAARYLTFRGYGFPAAPVIRFHPRCPSPYGRLPAMVCRMDDPRTGSPTGIHRTFIKPDGQGKAEVEMPKMMLGGANPVRLYEWEGDGLGLAEGIETALGVSQIFGWRPVWAAGSAGMIRRFPVLPAVAISIFADADRNGTGLAAARVCASRYANACLEATIHVPPKGSDWDSQARDVRA